MNINDHKYVAVFSKRLSELLQQRGYAVQKTDINERFPTKTVFYFHNCRGVREVMDEYRSGKY
jgi:hypothetical protein